MSKTVLVRSALQSAMAQACVSEPMRSAPLQVVGTDARMQANTLAAEVMAQAQMDSKPWLRFAWRIINGTTDMRAQFCKVLDEMKRDMRRVNAEAGAVLGRDGKPDISKSDTKQAAARVNSALNRVSVMTTIANAFNGGGTIDGLLAHACESMRLKLGECTQDQIGLEVIYEYAKKFSGSKAGPKPKAFLVKLTKWLEEAGKPHEDSATYAQDMEHHAQVVALVAKLQWPFPTR